MKVFYVIVLVLVAGAVPSHGRTESEGTVFNKTQSHESMNNVTVSNIKLVPYGNSYLVMQWPRSFCNSRSIYQIPCYYQQVPDRFTVHGLWPQTKSGGGIDCTNRCIYGNYPLFECSQLCPRLVPLLNTYWPDLTSSENNNERFWGTEYNKHGSCTFRNQNDYFELTLTVVEGLGISRIGGGPIIIPGYYYWPIEIKRAVQKVTNKMPRLKCITVGTTIQLLEISFCVDQNGNVLDVCKGVLDCGNWKVYLPLP
nr:ribonuclease S-2-like [Quercus suber]POE81626.1 ribonuclease s-2 [Quercus suber]